MDDSVMDNKNKPYDLMWHSTAYGPYFGDIGLGIGLIKVASNLSMSKPLCPAFLRLDPDKDKKLTEWAENSGGQAAPGVFPDIEICSELDLVKREWAPDQLKSFYRLKDIDIVQQTVVSPSGVHCRIKAEKAIKFNLSGISFGPCKVMRLPDGLHVVEVHPVLRPCEYAIRFSTKPVKISCEGEYIAADGVMFHDEKASWSFEWDDAISELEISVETARSFSPEEEELAPLSEDGSAKISVANHKSFARHLQEQTGEWDEFFAKEVPVIECPDSRVDQLNRYLAWIYRSNTIQHGGILPYPYSIPKQTFIGWWMWDTAKSAIAGSWYGNREAGWGGLLNTENLQYDHPNKDAGVITNSACYHGVDCWYSPSPESERFTCIPYAIPQEHGSGTHPPMFSLAMWSLWSVDGNERLMRRLLNNALSYNEYFENNRASRSVPGLLVVNRWSDSGMDNSKRWANQNNRSLNGFRHYSGVDWELPVISVDVNVYDITEKLCLAEMCRAAGMEQEADRLEKAAKTREEILHKELWNSERSSYFDRIESDGRFSPVIAPTNLSPLMLKSLPQNRIEPMLSWLFDEKHFWGDFPIPSIAKSDADFEPSKGYWMGPVWMSYTMDILRGLCYHSPEAAGMLLDKLLNMMLPDGVPAVYENYQPLTGAGIECPNFSWNGQIVDIIMRDMFGISCKNGIVTATSKGVPREWDHWKVGGVCLHGKRYSIIGKKVREQWRHEIIEE